MSVHQTLQNAEKDAETVTYAELDEHGKPIINEDGTVKKRTLKAAFQAPSNLERHVRSDKVFDSLYNPDQSHVAVIIGSMYVMPNQKWVPTSDGGHVWINAFNTSYVKSLADGVGVDNKIKEAGYQEVSNDVATVNRWRVLRRGPCINQPSDAELCTNTIQYAQRYIDCYEDRFMKDLKEEVRPQRQDVVRPDTLESMYQEAYKEGDSVRVQMKKAFKLKVRNVKKNPKLTRKQKLQATRILRKQYEAELNSLLIRVPKNAVSDEIETTQKFCALAWLLTPKYDSIDETDFFGCPPINPDTDPNPKKIFTEKDFDEAMMVQFLQAFETEKECQEFIDNKAKHDLQFAQVTCVKMRTDVPLDTMITKEFQETVEKGYVSKALQQTMVERKKLAQQAAQSAKLNPELVRKAKVENDKVVIEPSEYEQRAAKAMLAEGKRIQAEKAKEQAEKEEEEGGGGTKKREGGPIHNIEVESAMMDLTEREETEGDNDEEEREENTEVKSESEGGGSKE